MASDHFTIVGAGLCGSLLAIMLRRQGHTVALLERRADPRTAKRTAGRSINLALSARGIRALRQASIFSRIEPVLVPMRGRIVHPANGATELQPYGQREHEQIYSVSRAELNRILIDTAESELGINFQFEREVRSFDPETCELQVTDLVAACDYTVPCEPVIAADGAGSLMRRSLGAQVGGREELLAHGYKELALPADAAGKHQLDPRGLHIWPRGGFMLIALPNPGGDFTLTLFLPNEGKDSFASLGTPSEVDNFFRRCFADVVPLIPELVETFLANPTGILGTVRCRRWHVADKVMLIGDAAHAIVPFHGQGMNLAFEDCSRLVNVLEGEQNLDLAFSAFEADQRPNADAIADMALENYVEMRDTVLDPKHKLRKELSFALERRLPNRFIPRYSMVMFHDEIPYAMAQQRGAVQQQLIDELVRDAVRLDDIDLEKAERQVCERLAPL